MQETSATRSPSFGSADLISRLQTMTPAELDQLPFGVIGFDDDEKVRVYNTFESEMSGIDRNRVLGRNLFTAVAPCTNNYLVAERFRTETELDELIDYVFTLRMQPTPVRLRLLAKPDGELSYMVVARSAQASSAVMP